MKSSLRSPALSGLAFLAVACGSERGKTPPGSAEAVPAPEVLDRAGLDRLLASHLGTPLLLNFWATWCVPCIAEIPDLKAAVRGFRERGGVLIGVSIDFPGREDRTDEPMIARVRASMAEHGIDYPVVIWRGEQGDLERAFGFAGSVPFTVAISPAGKVVATHDGQADREELAALIAKIPPR